MKVQRIQTTIHKIRNTVSSLFSSIYRSNREGYKPVAQLRGILQLRILIQPETFYDTDPVLLYCYIVGLKDRLPKIKIEVEPADIPSDKLCYVTEIHEGRLKWQGYLSRLQEIHRKDSSAQPLSPEKVCYILEAVIYSIFQSSIFLYPLPLDYYAEQKYKNKFNQKTTC